jgi:hypothetical protein
VFTAQPLNQSRWLQSLAAPFSALFDMSLEQPVFGANYIKGKLRTDSSANSSPTNQNVYQFKLKFNRGGAVEFGQAMREASRRVASMAASNPSANYTPSTFASNQYYQAPDSVYQPNYPVGFALPTQVFSQSPPPGFVYTYQAPPPYPGLVTAASQQPAPATTYAPAYNPQNVGFGSSVEYPVYPQTPQYPTQYPPSSQPGQPQYPPQYPPQPGQPQYPPPSQHGQPQYPPTQGYVAPQAPPQGYGPASDYTPPQAYQQPQQQAGYPAYPPQPPSAPGYPSYPPTNDYSANGPQAGAPPGYTPATHGEAYKKGNWTGLTMFVKKLQYFS